MGWKLTLVSLFFLLQLNSRAQTPIDITFEVKGMPDGFCRIIGMVGNNNYLLDSFPAKNGVAHYTHPKPADAGLFYFVLPDQQAYFQFLLDIDQAFIMKTDVADFTGNMVITGSKDNELFYDNLKFENRFRKQYDSVEQLIKSTALYKPDLQKQEAFRDELLAQRKAYIANLAKNHPNSFFTHFKLAGQNPELQYPKKADGTIDTLQQNILFRDAYWNNTNIADERLVRTPVVVNKLKTYTTQLMAQRPDTIIKYITPLIEKAKTNPVAFKFVVNWLAIQYEKPAIMGGEKVLVFLVDNYFKDEYALPWFKETPYELTKIRLRVDNMRPSTLGKTGQDLRAKNLNGVYESLYEMKAPVKVVMLYSPDCEHCQKEAPELATLVKKYNGKVDVYALTVDKDEAKWREFVTKYNTENFHNVFDPEMESKYYKKYHVDITPEIYVLDKNNIIVAKDLHPNQLEPVFDELVATGTYK